MAATGSRSGMLPDGMPSTHGHVGAGMGSTGPMDLGYHHHHHHQLHHHHHNNNNNNHNPNQHPQHPLAQQHQYIAPASGSPPQHQQHYNPSAATAANLIRGRLASSAGLEEILPPTATSPSVSSLRRHSLAATSISGVSPSIPSPVHPNLKCNSNNNSTGNGITITPSSTPPPPTPIQRNLHLQQVIRPISNPMIPTTSNDPPTSTPSNPNPLLSSKPIRRRMRMITSCLECRRRKLKCNKSQPCTNCLKFSRECLYLGPKLDEASQLRLTEIKEKVGSLERQLERDVAGKSSAGSSSSMHSGGYAPPPPPHQTTGRIVADEMEDDLDEMERDLEITPMVALDLTYEDDADGMGPMDDLIDLGIQVGRMRITERIGGLNRPRISEEIQAGLGGLQTPLGASTVGGVGGSGGMSGGEYEVPEFLRPGASYIPPTSGVFFGQVVQSPSLLHFLPNQATGDRLMARYFDAVHPIARCVHQPSFEPVYAMFWDDVNQGFEPRASVQALVFAAWFSAAVSLDEGQVNREYGFSRSQLVENMKVGTEAALSKANFLRTTKVETMQAFVMYMLPLCRDEVSRAHSVLVGAAVRMAECMGLHRDGQAYGLNPLETQVRRLVWHQLCFLDIRTCEAQGPKPGIRREDYDTTLPLNVEESDLTIPAAGTPPTAEHWTSNLISIIRFELNEMMRIIWSDRRKIESRKTNLAAVLLKIENFRKRMFEKYDHLLDDTVPIQRYTKLVMHLLIYRLHAMVLHPYHSNASNPMPDRLSNVLVMSGIMIIEITMHLEINPLFKNWAWYTGAYQQFQIALLLATEIYYHPNNREADRIWGCLDYVFGLESGMPRGQKSYVILSEIMGKTGVYMSMRKMRAPMAMARAVPGKMAVRESLGGGSSSSSPGGSSSSGSTVCGLSNLKSEPGVGGGGPLDGGGRQGQRMDTDMGMGVGVGSSMVSSSGGGGGGGAGAPVMMMSGGYQNMVFAGVSNGEVLWGLPPGNPGSPNSSDGGSVVGQNLGSMQSQTGQGGNGGGGGMGLNGGGGNGSVSGGGGGGGVSVMGDLDWETINMLFPADPQTGDFNFNMFVPDPSIHLGAASTSQGQGQQQQHPGQTLNSPASGAQAGKWAG